MRLRLKHLRKEKNITQSELAARLGVTRSLISLWEKGERIPRSEEITKMCRYFGVTVDYLCGRADRRNVVTAPETFTMDITRLNGKGCEILLEFYKFLLQNEKYTN